MFRIIIIGLSIILTFIGILAIIYFVYLLIDEIIFEKRRKKLRDKEL